MIYHYSPLSGDKETSPAIYPLIPVVVIYKHQIINRSINCLVDSGAESCYCFKPIGDYLKINFKKSKPVESIAANKTKFIGVMENIHLLVNGKKIETSFIFSDDLNPDFPIVLGQRGFFSEFKICFEKSKNLFSID